MELFGQGAERESRYSDEKLRALLSHQAKPQQHIEGLLALGLTPDDLFSLLAVHEEDLSLVSEDQLEEAKEIFDDWGDPAVLIEIFGADEEDLKDGIHAYLERITEENNAHTKALFSDMRFLSRRGQRIFKDVAKTAFILMEDTAANRPLVAAWLLTPNLNCEGERPIDHLKSDPVQVHAMASGLIFSDEGKISDSYGKML